MPGVRGFPVGVASPKVKGELVLAPPCCSGIWGIRMGKAFQSSTVWGNQVPEKSRDFSEFPE